MTSVSLCSSGMSEPDFSLYPSLEMQLDWLHTYLQAYKLFTKKGEDVSQRELETLYVQVNKFALVSETRERKCCHETVCGLVKIVSIELKLPVLSVFSSALSGLTFLLGFLGPDPSKVLLHRLWLPRVSQPTFHLWCGRIYLYRYKDDYPVELLLCEEIQYGGLIV